MKTSLGAFVLIATVFCSVARAATITTLPEFKQALAGKERQILLDAATFNLDSNIVVEHDCTIRPHENRSGKGGVTIDGMNLFTVTFRNAAFRVGVDDARNVLTFTRGRQGTVVTSPAADTKITFDYCHFLKSTTGDGLATRSGAFKLTATCNNCQSNGNKNDGFNQHNTANKTILPNPGEHVVTLNNCSATDNDSARTGGAAGDGISPHEANETVFVHGGTYYRNGKSGISALGGSKVFIDGGTVFYGNGFVQPNGDILVLTGTYIEIKDAIFKDLHRPDAPHVGIREEARAVISNCVFRDAKTTGGRYVHIYKGGSATISNSTFANGDKDQIAIEVGNDGTLDLKECTLTNNSRNVVFSGVGPSQISGSSAQKTITKPGVPAPATNRPGL